AVNASFGQIFSVALDHHGNIFICTNSDNTIRKVNPRGIVTTIVGDSVGYPRFAGDGGPSTAASLSSPFSIATDRYGNLFIADAANRRVRKVDTNGIITTVAGNGGYTPGGDGGYATNAAIGAIGGVAVDAAGNIYIADANSRVRKVNTSGIISTIAGNGSLGFSGDGGPATAAVLDGAIGVCTDLRGNVYIADKNNDEIRIVNTSGIIKRFAGTGTAGFSGDGGQATAAKISSPNAVRCDLYGNIYVTDQGNNRIRRVDTNGVIRTVAGNGTSGFAGDGGPATAARLTNPSDVAFDQYNNLFIADKGRGVNFSDGHRIREVYRVDTLHLTASPGDTVCGLATVTFTATGHAAYYNGIYQWRLNGSVVGTDSNQYSNPSLNNGDVITCTVVDPLVSGALLAVSDTIRMVVHPAVIPRLSVFSSSDSLCSGQSVTLTTSSINGGTAPVYNWYRFGTLIGTGATFTYVPAPGDIITCILTSNAICATPDTAMATRPMTVNISYPPDVSVTAHPSAMVPHLGDRVTLLTETTYGGTHPTYQWYKNGEPVPGATDDSYSQEVYWGDTLYCVMHSNLPCVVPEYDTSNITYIGVGRVAVTHVAGNTTQFSVFPNPASHMVTIAGLNASGTKQDIIVSLRNTLGQTVCQQTVAYNNIGKITITLPEGLPEGLYYLSVAAEGISGGTTLTIRQ
ncbi:MAG: T9SS C-terminal target domain-containing protein, partial [Chitinophagia bacterium]|nr:T9SS C-terminal target domain-containing protein [Chitinophagia bacterium]